MKAASINPLLETFYWVKSFARIIRKIVTPLQNWKSFSLPKNVDPWVSSIAANKASQTCRVWLYNAHWRPLATPWITDTPTHAEGSVDVSCGDLKIPVFTGIIADICKNVDGIIGMRRFLRNAKNRDNYQEIFDAEPLRLGLDFLWKNTLNSAFII